MRTADSIDRYHYKSTGFPENLIPKAAVMLSYSPHAREEAERDERGPIPLLTSFCTIGDEVQLIEMDVDSASQEVVKAVYRMPLDGERDVILAVVPRSGTRPWRVKTVWSLYRGEMPPHRKSMATGEIVGNR